MPNNKCTIYNVQFTKRFKKFLHSTFYIVHSNRGFTLIELMIAISILAILTTAGAIAYSNVQKNARDHRRKEDLRALSVALELYKQKNKIYPPATSWLYSYSSSDPWISGLDTNYMPSLPKDPSQMEDCSGMLDNYTACYTYAYFAIDNDCVAKSGESYILATRLENKNDLQSGNQIKYGTCTYPTSGIKGVFLLSPN